MKNYSSFAHSCIGENHIKRDLDCQDSSINISTAQYSFYWENDFETPDVLMLGTGNVLMLGTDDGTSFGNNGMNVTGNGLNGTNNDVND